MSHSPDLTLPLTPGPTPHSPSTYSSTQTSNTYPPQHHTSTQNDMPNKRSKGSHLFRIALSLSSSLLLLPCNGKTKQLFYASYP